jgi:hypothetical protein
MIGFFIVLPWAIAVWQIVNAVGGMAVSSMTIVEMLLLLPLAVVGFGAIPFWISRGSRLIGGHHSFKFADEDIHLTGPDGESRVRWSALTRCFGTQHGILFYSGNRPMISIPGRALARVDAAELRAMSAARGVKIVGRWGGAPAT